MVYRVLTICTGNICRSPMMEFLLKDALDSAGLGDQVEVRSAGTTAWEEGEPIDSRAAKLLSGRGLETTRHRARQMTATELRAADLILVLDNDHVAPVHRMLGSSPDAVRLVREFDPAAGEDLGIRDPWYGDDADFGTVAQMIDAALPGIVEHVRREVTSSQ